MVVVLALNSQMNSRVLSVNSRINSRYFGMEYIWQAYDDLVKDFISGALVGRFYKTLLNCCI